MYQILKSIPENGEVQLTISRAKDGNIQVMMIRNFPDAKVPLHPLLIVAGEDDLADEINAAIRAYRIGTDNIMQQVEHALAASKNIADSKIKEKQKPSPKPTSATATTKAKAEAAVKQPNTADANTEDKEDT